MSRRIAISHDSSCVVALSLAFVLLPCVIVITCCLHVACQLSLCFKSPHIGSWHCMVHVACYVMALVSRVMYLFGWWLTCVVLTVIGCCMFTWWLSYISSHITCSIVMYFLSCLDANMADFTSVDARINIRPSRRPWATTRSPFSMKHPSLLNRTCIPCSTI